MATQTMIAHVVVAGAYALAMETQYRATMADMATWSGMDATNFFDSTIAHDRAISCANIATCAILGAFNMLDRYVYNDLHHTWNDIAHLVSFPGDLLYDLGY